MTARTLGIPAALVALVAVWGIIDRLPQRARSARGSEPPALMAFFDAAGDSSVALIRVYGPTDSVTLERTGGVWTANGFRADPGAIDRLRNALRGVRAGEIIATNPANHGRFGLSTDSARRIDIHVGRETRALLAGRTGPRSGTSYVRLPANDTVRLLESDLSLRVAFAADDWRDHRVLSTDTAAVARIAVERNAERYALVRRDRAWTFADGGLADTAAVRVMLSELVRLRALGFVKATDPIAAQAHGGAVVALGATGDTLATLTFSAGPGDRWARVRGDSVVYQIGDYRVERLAPARKQITAR